MIATYKIVRIYSNSKICGRTIRTGLTLGEATQHCRDPESDSKTCTSYNARQRTKKVGAWFDGYTQENKEERD